MGSTAMKDDREREELPRPVEAPLRRPANDTQDLADHALHIGYVLQSSLDVTRIIELFAAEIAPLVPHDGLRFVSPYDQIEVEVGAAQPHRCVYQLVLSEQPLGDITVTRRRPFTVQELERLETLMCALVYPLRNAMLYKRAVETAYRDPVTGVSNRAAMEMTLEREIELSRRHGTALSIILLDIDYFKTVNDTHGHPAGDATLGAVARTLLACSRSSDVVFRYGGEEFAVLLRNTDREGAHLLALRIREAVERLVIEHKETPIRLTASLGVATLAAGEHAPEFLQNADQALYRAKKEGRNRVVVHDAPEQRSAAAE